MLPITVETATAATLPDLVEFFGVLEKESHPDDAAAPGQAEAGLRQSLDAFAFLSSNTCWLLLARVQEEPVGYAFVVRIPKVDIRVGFLFVDEVYVRRPYRGQGVGQALVERIQTLSQQLGLAGVRLLVRPENRAGRALYQKCGFQEGETLFCQWQKTH